MRKQRVHRVALVGAGPRGVSVLERLLAHVRADIQASAGAADTQAGPRDADSDAGDESPGSGVDTAQERLHIDLIDPYPAGEGHVWQTGQSRLFLMNTPAFVPTVSPGDLLPVRPVAGVSFDQWRVRARENTADPKLELSVEDADELEHLKSTDFPSRALYGRYLNWMVARLLEQAGPEVTISLHRTEAVRLVPGQDCGFSVELFNGEELETDSAVLALGHLPAELRPDQQLLLTSAAKHGLRYWPPSIPGDVDLSAVPAEEPILIRGLGLNFFDIMIALTVGRGGRFVDTGEGPGAALRYEPSGQEPILYGGSRRGTPYRAKVQLSGTAGGPLRFCTMEQAGRFAAAGVQPSFDHDLWPLLHRDALWAYYMTLARVAPASFRHGAQTFLAALDELLVPEPSVRQPWDHQVQTLVEQHLDAADQLKLRQLGRPFAGQRFAGTAAHDTAVLEYLQAEASGAAKGANSPLIMALSALRDGRKVLKATIADGGLTDASWLGELCGWFEPFVEGLVSGPPPVRLEQLAALVRAGVVHFLGPDPKFTVDEGAGLFSAGSPWVAGGPVTAAHMLEATMPANRVAQSVSPLLSQLIADGLARPKMMLCTDGTAVPSSGLDVTTPPYRVRRKSGQPHQDLYVLGLQLSSVQWGTALAADASGPIDSGARTLKDADGIARAILRGAVHCGAASGVEPRKATGRTGAEARVPS